MGKLHNLLGFSFFDTLSLEDYKIVEYFPYTTIVVERIIEQNHNYPTIFDDFLNELWDEIEKTLETKHHITPDNKVAVKLVPKERNGRKGFSFGSIYVGRKDGIISIGLGVWQPWDFTKDGNKKFE